MITHYQINLLADLAYAMLLAAAFTTFVLLCFRRLKQRSLSIALAILLPATVGAAAIKPKAIATPAAAEAPNKRALPPDSLVKITVLPMVELALVDATYRKELTAQMERVVGKETLRRFAFEMICDEKPRLRNSPILSNNLRKLLELTPDKTNEEIRAEKTGRDRPAAGSPLPRRGQPTTEPAGTSAPQVQSQGAK